MLIQNNHSQFCGIYFQARVAAANKTKSGQAATAPKKIERAVFIDDISGQQTEFGADTARVINAKSSQVVVSSGNRHILPVDLTRAHKVIGELFTYLYSTIRSASVVALHFMPNKVLCAPSALD